MSVPVCRYAQKGKCIRGYGDCSGDSVPCYDYSPRGCNFNGEDASERLRDYKGKYISGIAQTGRLC